jgi:hypothetical protein
MHKSCLFISRLLLLFSFSAVTLAAADSCKDYSGDTKNICNSVANTKNDFNKKYTMSATSPQNQSNISSCNRLSGIEKDACLTRNNFVEQHSLAKTSGTQAVQSTGAPSRTVTELNLIGSEQHTVQSTGSSSETSQSSGATTERNPTESGQHKVNIFNN